MTIELSGEAAYLNLLKDVLENGIETTDRTGVGTISLFGKKLVFDVSDQFPILTTKFVSFNNVAAELLWFLEGSTDERRLAELTYGKPREELTDKKTIWYGNANADYWKPKAKFDGDLGKVYGYQWRNFGGIDQISKVIESIKTDPYSRRHIVSAWNPPELSEMALPPCHILFQFHVDKLHRLSLQIVMRSNDLLLGQPYNHTSYALLLEIVAKLTNLKAYELHMVIGDAHIYKNHISQVEEQLSRKILDCKPKLQIANISNLSELTMDHISLVDYKYLPSIKAPMAV